MNFIDFHADTLYRLFYQKNNELGDLWNNECQVDIRRLRQSGYTAQIFACFLDLNHGTRFGSHYQDILHMIDYFNRQAEKYKDEIRYAGNYYEYQNYKQHNILTGFLSLEEGGVLENQIERLDELYEKGIRVMNMTWNHENCLGYTHKKPEFRSKGLKPFGIEVLEHMDEIGMIVDVSHLSDGGFQDVVKYGKRAFMATHSNARALRDVSRNLTDDMIRQIADRGGIIGLNFYSDFLSYDPISRVSDILRHCKHIMKVGGENVVGFGTDFDGMDIELEIEGAQDMPNLVKAMEKDGFTARQIEQVCYKNAEDFFRRYWGLIS